MLYRLPRGKGSRSEVGAKEPSMIQRCTNIKVVLVFVTVLMHFLLRVMSPTELEREVSILALTSHIKKIMGMRTVALEG